MKTIQITLKGWANDSMLFFSQNSNSKYFTENFLKLKEKLTADGFKILENWERLRDKKATEKIVVKGWYWRGSWSDPSKNTFCIFYK